MNSGDILHKKGDRVVGFILDEGAVALIGCALSRFALDPPSEIPKEEHPAILQHVEFLTDRLMLASIVLQGASPDCGDPTCPAHEAERKGTVPKVTVDHDGGIRLDGKRP